MGYKLGGNENLSPENREKLDQNFNKLEKSKDEVQDEYKFEDEIDDEEDNPKNILVRGALLRCTCGTHCRRLNLPLSYGVYVEEVEKAKVHENNCIVGDDKNISYYGVCKSNTVPDSEDICLEPYVWPDGTKTSNEKINGKRCTPVILEKWFDAQEDEKIYDPDTGEWYGGIRSNSFMVCKYGGIIIPETSGQEEIKE